MPKEGSGTFDGVKYTYKLSRQSWFGVYTCNVHKSFLHEPGKRFRTDEFQVGGHDWDMGLLHNEDGTLAAALISQDLSEVTAHLGFTAVNHVGIQRNRATGYCKKFQFHEVVGPSQLMSIAEIRDRNAGFLNGDYFVIKLEIRLKLPENEECSLSVEGNIGTFTWKLKDLHGMGPWLMWSEEFNVARHKWQLSISPCGFQHDKSVLPFSLISLGKAAVKTTLKFSIINHQSSDKSVTFKGEHEFNNTNAYMIGGFFEMRPCQDATLGFLKDGWITLTTSILVLGQEQGIYIPPKLRAALHPRRGKNMAEACTSSQAENAAQGGSGDWRATGHQNSEGLLVKLDNLEPGTVLTNKYMIGDERIPGKPHIRFAVNQLSGQEVVLKFYSSRDSFKKSFELNKLLPARYVCNAIDFIDDDKLGLPCLVFERGSCTLERWIKEGHADYFKRKAVLCEVLQCLKSIHRQDIVHCDIKPSNIMFFPSSHSWKLLDADLGAKTGEWCAIRYTLMYAAPEIIQAEERGEKSFVAETSMDMWSFGVLAFEVLTGKRFYSSSATVDLVKECLCGRRDLPSLESVEERQARRWLGGLLCTDEGQRWSAQRSLLHAMFQTAEDTTQKAAGIDRVVKSTEEVKTEIREVKDTLPSEIGREVREPLSEEISKVASVVEYVRGTVVATHHEICKANLLANIEIEQLEEKDVHLNVEDRAGQAVLTMADDFIEDQPIFLLENKRVFRIRISLAHKHQSDASSFKINYIALKPSNGIEKEVDIAETKPPSEGNEVVAFFDTESFQSSKLAHGCPQFGSVEEKYIEIAVTIGLDVKAGNARPASESHFEMKGNMWCLPVSEHNPSTNVRKFMRFASEKWKTAPQWMRDAARGAVVLANIGLKAAMPVATPAHKSFFCCSIC